MAPSHEFSIHNNCDNEGQKIPTYCGRSKAQMCLQKILHIIQTIPPPTQMEEVSQPPATTAAVATDNELMNTQEVLKIAAVDEVIDEKKEKDCMGLLIEAAKMIFGEFKKEEEEEEEEEQQSETTAATPTRQPITRKKRSRISQRWTVDLYAEEEDEIMEPVVRSKRGRTQVLPGKYRDSVLELPLTRHSRNRSTIIANKRKFR